MQLGTRWAVGAESPTGLPDEVRAAVLSVEAEVDHLDTSQWRWTLTWLEGRPVVELDDGTMIRYEAGTGATIIRATNAADDSSLDS